MCYTNKFDFDFDFLQLHSEQWGLNCVEGNGEIEERDPHTVSSVLQVRQGPLQQVDDSVIHPTARLVRKLQGIYVSMQSMQR